MQINNGSELNFHNLLPLVIQFLQLYSTLPPKTSGTPLFHFNHGEIYKLLKSSGLSGTSFPLEAEDQSERESESPVNSLKGGVVSVSEIRNWYRGGIGCMHSLREIHSFKDTVTSWAMTY